MIEINKIYQGDCLEIMKNISDKCTNLILTDPPWNVKKDYGKYKDNLSEEGYIEFIKKLKAEWERITIDGKYAIILGSEILKTWWDIFPDSKVIIVKLGAIVLTRKNNFHLQWKAILTNCISKQFSTDLWEDIRWPGEGYFFNEPRYGHPAMTPLKLMARIINLFTEKGDLIYDPFMGVGTTAHACKQTHRNFIGSELNSQYIKIANKRIKNVQMELLYDNPKT
jgi:site-specific DNA-methyltransferase (adenine-specific)